MSEYLIQGKSLTDIADAIREKAGSADAMTPAEMVEAILGIQASGGVAFGTLTVAADRETNFSVHHGLNKLPSAFVLYRESDTEEGSATGGGMICLYATQTACRVVRQTQSSKSTTLNTFASTASYYLGHENLACTNDEIIWSISPDVAEMTAGYVYRWFVM